MTFTPSQIDPFINATAAFLASLAAVADQDLVNGPDILAARAVLDRDLRDLISGRDGGDEQAMAMSILAIVNADAGMAENGIDLTRPPLRAPWDGVQEAAAPLLDALAG